MDGSHKGNSCGFGTVSGLAVTALARRDMTMGMYCYARRTLVGRSGTKSSQGRYSRRDAMSLRQPEILRSKSTGVKVLSRMLKDSRVR